MSNEVVNAEQATQPAPQPMTSAPQPMAPASAPQPAAVAVAEAESTNPLNLPYNHPDFSAGVHAPWLGKF